MVTYQDAVQNPSLRQSYLDSVLVSCPKSIQQVLYDPDHSILIKHLDALVEEEHYTVSEGAAGKLYYKNAEVYFSLLMPPKKIGSGQKAIVYATELAFVEYSNERIFQHMIIEHEGVHTDHLFEGIYLPDGLVINSSLMDSVSLDFALLITEVLACRNEYLSAVQQFKGEDDETQRYIQRAHGDKICFKNELRYYVTENPDEKRIKKRVLDYLDADF